jgi:hypothetical protein
MVDESGFQKQMSNAILENEANGLTLRLTENKQCIIAEIGDMDSLYTADEARDLAMGIWQIATVYDEWDQQSDGLVAYLRELADVVDGNKTAEELSEEWEIQPEVNKNEIDHQFKKLPDDYTSFE